MKFCVEYQLNVSNGLMGYVTLHITLDKGFILMQLSMFEIFESNFVIFEITTCLIILNTYIKLDIDIYI